MEYANRCYFKTMITAMKNVNSFTCSVFFLIRNVKTQVHRGSWAFTWWQLRNVIYVTTAITSDNLVCEISPLWTNLLFSILQSVFHYFTILWDGLFWNINDITNIPLSGAVFINCICLSYWWHTLVCKYIISTGIYCYTILPKNKFICLKIWLFLLVLHH